MPPRPRSPPDSYPRQSKSHGDAEYRSLSKESPPRRSYRRSSVQPPAPPETQSPNPPCSGRTPPHSSAPSPRHSGYRESADRLPPKPPRPSNSPSPPPRTAYPRSARRTQTVASSAASPAGTAHPATATDTRDAQTSS